MSAPPTTTREPVCSTCGDDDPDCAAECSWGVAPCGCGLGALRQCPHDDDRTQDDHDNAVLDRETE